MKLASAGLVAVLSVVASASYAAVPFYLGGSGSLVTAGNFSAQAFNSDLSFDPARTSEDKETIGFKVTGGFTLAPWVALEGGYVDFGKASFSTVSNGPPCCLTADYQTGPVSGSVATHGLDLALVLQWPLPNDITIGVRGGLLKWDLKPEVRDSRGERPTKKQNGQNFFYGVDVRIPIAGRVALALDYDVYKLGTDGSQRPPQINHYEVSALSLGVIVPFGKDHGH